MRTSALDGEGVRDLKKKIHDALWDGAYAGCEGPLVSNLRHKLAIERATEALRSGRKALNEGGGEELVAADVRTALDCLGEIVGEVTTEDILADIFSRFCVGK